MFSRVLRAIAATVFGAALSPAQSIAVYSEFTRIDPFGNIVKADRGNDPREILSPALPRNATTSVHLVLEAPAGADYTIYIGQNPENAVAEQLYLERYSKVGNEWIPDDLDAVALPYHGVMGAGAGGAPGPIDGQTHQAFWLAMKVARDATPARIKVEPQISIGQQWLRYPMEARVVEVTAPSSSNAEAPERAAIGAASDISARRVWKRKLCGNSEKLSSVSTLNIRDFIARDAVQDVAMSSATPAGRLWDATGVRDREEWCRSETPHPNGPEWYLRLRDHIIGASR